MWMSKANLGSAGLQPFRHPPSNPPALMLPAVAGGLLKAFAAAAGPGRPAGAGAIQRRRSGAARGALLQAGRTCVRSWPRGQAQPGPMPWPGFRVCDLRHRGNPGPPGKEGGGGLAPPWPSAACQKNSKKEEVSKKGT